ncbi:MAG: hypothetical protein NUV49_01065 [Patescibacteria group bacterium]|nr:hypothetical protein [Patescibacteria group bacterium]
MRIQRDGAIKETAFTPGPWSAEYHMIQDGDGGDKYAIIHANGEVDRIICKMPTWVHRQEADAALIAKSPDAIEALENCRIALVFYREWMAREHLGTSYPFGIDCENEAKRIVDEVIE